MTISEHHKRLLDRHTSRRRILKTGAALGIAPMLPVGAATTRAQEQITIDYWNWWDVYRVELMDGIIAQFQIDNPGIVVNNVPQTWDRRDEVVTTALSGGEPPEVIMASRQEIVRFADAGAVAPISKYVEADAIDLTRYYDSEIASMWWKDQIYSLPMPTAGGETGLTFYSKDQFTAAGLDPETPPTTWAELDTAAAALTKRTEDGAIDVMGASLDFSAGGYLANLYVNAGTLYSEDLRTVAFNSEQGVQTLQWMLDFAENHYGGYQNMLDFDLQFTEGQQPLLMGPVAHQYQNVSMFFHIEQNDPGFNYGVGYRPYNSDNPNAKFQGVAGLTFGWGYIIPSGLDPAVEEAAWKFVKRITYEDVGACSFMQSQLRPSPLQDCNSSTVFSESNPHWDKVLGALESDVPVGIVPPQSQVFSVLTEYLELAAFGEVDAQGAIDEAAAESQAMLDEYWGTQA
ncbi:MAG: extracellular solute-binding protein [Thermomicrobiales bacterium]